MSTYGTRDATQFPLPTVEKGAKFYTLVDSTTKEITLKKISSGNILGRTDLDTTVGTVPTSGANAGKFIQNPNLGLTADQKAALQNPQTLKTVKDKGTETVSKAIQKSGKTPEEAQATANKLLSPNKANSPDGTGSTPTAAAAPGTDSDEVNQKNQTLTYPEDIRSTKQDVIKFTLLEYQASGVGATQSAGTSARGSLAKGIPSGRKQKGSVVLPIPSGISDTNACDWGSNSMNALQASMAAGAFTAITGGIGEGIESLRQSFETAGGEAGTKTALGAAFAGAAAQGDGSAILKRADGSVINPNMELLFNGPTLRPFSFTFKMSARSDTEAKEIIKIIRFFKRGMAPQKSTTNLFLKTPNTFSIQYLYRPGGANKDHPFIGRIKECALQNFTVNYTPEGQYATYTDGVMVSYEMQMQFTELEPVFNSDYDEVKDGIGY